MIDDYTKAMQLARPLGGWAVTGNSYESIVMTDFTEKPDLATLESLFAAWKANVATGDIIRENLLADFNYKSVIKNCFRRD